MKVNCQNCNKEFEVSPSRPKRGQGKFCSYDCQNTFRKGKTWEEFYGGCKAEKLKQHYSKSLTGKNNPNFGNKKLIGKNNPNWIDGRSYQVYPVEFSKALKREIFERDNFQCQLCFTNKDLTVHHIDYNRLNCVKINLITLCRSHNSKVNFRREYYANLFRGHSHVQQGAKIATIIE